MWHCSRLVLKNKTRWTLFTRENWASFEKKREKLDSPFTQIGSPLPRRQLNLEEPVAEKSLESGQEEGKLETRWPRRLLSKSSQLLEKGVPLFGPNYRLTLGSRRS